MAKKHDELLKKLLATFRVEADEHLRAMSAGLLALEKITEDAPRTEPVEKIFREAHSLKGAARAVNLTAIEMVCQSLENIFAGLKSGRLSVSPPLFDLLHEAVNTLGGLLAADVETARTRSALVAALIGRLDVAATAKAARSQAATSTIIASARASVVDGDTEAVPTFLPLQEIASQRDRIGQSKRSVAENNSRIPESGGLLPASNSVVETVRISTVKLDMVMRQVEELLSPRLASGQRAGELREIAAALAVWKKERLRVQPALRRIERSYARKLNGNAREWQELPPLFDYLDIDQVHMKLLEDRLARLQRSAERDRRTLTGMTDGLLKNVKEMQLLPFASLLELLPRIARELARDQGKEVELVIQGGDIEIDRRILEEMKDPLIHLLRNAIDHAIERPAERAARGKPSRGILTFAISQRDGGKVEILIADDGAGIDAAGVKAAVSRLGMVSAEEAERLGEAEILAFTFQSGVSTSRIITDVSGRGLGLAIVREKVERLGGTVTLESQPDTGTVFRLILPLALANFRGVLVRAAGQFFVIPAASVGRVTRVAQREILTVENRETISLDGRAVSLVWLSDALELPRQATAPETAGNAPVVVLGSERVRVAFRVDEVLGEQEVLVKPLGPQLARVRNVAGATVLGTGRVVPVLNVADLLKSATRHVATPSAPVTAEQPAAAEKPSILVVEDSITSRSLLKNILESAGYRVTTAVDGAEAYTTLKTASFDLVVSDVEMPRMNGFDLTAKLRADKDLAELPVVLVTALESREHRERGIDAGANAYIVKSSFDQSNLLEVIRRLL